MINEQDLLNKTHYGLGIYSHLIHLGGQIKAPLHVSFPDCGLWPNPFDNYTLTLHITTDRVCVGNQLANYIARHHDISGTIPDGNAIDFAKLYFKLSGDSLIDKITEVLTANIKTEVDVHKMKTTDKYHDKLFSLFDAPISNIIPIAEMSVRDVYDYLVSDQAKAVTDMVRKLDEETSKKYKKYNFRFFTPSGTFTVRDGNHMKSPSGLMVIDIDHLALEEVESTFNLLMAIPRIETILLFRSPRGHGLKWVIPIINNEGHTHDYYFEAVSNYLETFGIVADPTGKDISRACFLPHDPQAYINQKYL